MRFVINARMKRRVGKAILLFLTAMVLTACGGRSINKKTAEKVITSEALLKSSSIDIESVAQTTSGQAIVQTKVEVAFRLEKSGGHWVIREVKIGNNPWEKLENVVLALNRVKKEETEINLQRIASAIDEYRGKNGRLPDFSDYVSLSDALSPDFLSPLIRLDSWGQPIVAVRISPAQVRLISTGPDGKMGTSDDISVTRTYQQK
jgi:hypothetical protein